jgi:hypothetical protein
MKTSTMITWAALIYIIYEMSKSGGVTAQGTVTPDPTGMAVYPNLSKAPCAAGLYAGQLSSNQNPYYVRELANNFNAGWAYGRPFTFQSE